MKCVIFSDLQANNYRSYAHYQGGYNSRLLEIVDVLRQIREYMNDHSIDTFFFLGDLFDPRIKIDVEILYLIGKEFKQWIRFTGYFLLGNHDKYEESDEVQTNPLEIMLNNKFNIVSDAQYCIGNVLMIPYRTSREKFIADIDMFRSSIKESLDKYTLMIHQGIVDITLPNERCARSSGSASNLIATDDVSDFGVVFTGHWHGARKKKNVYVVGSPLQFDFNDIGEERGFIVYDTDEHSVERVTTTYRKFVDYEIKSKKELVSLLKSLPSLNVYPRIVLPEDLVDWLPKNRNFSIKIVPSAQQQQSYRIKLSDEWSYEELLKKYVEFHNKDISYAEFGLRILGEAK